MKNNELNMYDSQSYYNQNEDYDRKKKKIIIIILLIFIIVLLLSLGLYILLFNKKDANDVNVDYNDLLVIHSKSDYGDTISSFNTYSTKDSAYSYTFYIDNVNDDEIKYSVYFIDYSSNQSINKSQINYSIIKNNEVIYTGILDNLSIIKLTSNKVPSHSKDNYELKMWSDSNITDFKFKIKVGE